jgi:proline iminopeptidase
MKTIFSTIFFFATLVVQGQNIYLKTFGDNKSKPIIFLHGGPGYNCANFEVTTAQKLADDGFFVIVYDRRGEGRSKDKNAKFTFKETFDDINNIYQKYGLTRSTLVGHSFGGVIATLFAKENPKKIKSIILVGTPVSLQATFKNILQKSKAIYSVKKDSVNLNYISMLENMDSTSIEYSSYCFTHAMMNSFYSPKNPTVEAQNIYSTFRTDTLLRKYGSQMSYQAPQSFWKNEKYTTLDLKTTLDDLKKQKIKVFSFYGKDDGLYSIRQVTDLQKQLGADNLVYLDNCSHNVFIDQQGQFIATMKKWTK